MQKTWLQMGTVRVMTARIVAYNRQGVDLIVYTTHHMFVNDCETEEKALQAIELLDELLSPSPLSNISPN